MQTIYDVYLIRVLARVDFILVLCMWNINTLVSFSYGYKYATVAVHFLLSSNGFTKTKAYNIIISP